MEILEKFIGMVSPSMALARASARVRLEAIRSYDAAAKSRRTKNWKATSAGPNLEGMNALVTLRNRSREIVRNNSFARRSIKIIYTNTIGGGIRPKIKASGKRDLKVLKEAWQKWAETTACDFNEQKNFYGLQAQIMRCVAESGECIIRKRRVNGIIPIQLQVVEPDLLDQNRNFVNQLGKVDSKIDGYIIQGVEFDANGKRIAYWMYENHPNEFITTSLISYRVPASEIIHVYDVERPGQVRGIPFGVATMLKLRDFDDYEDAELTRQKIAACFSVFVHDSAEQLTGQISGTETETNGDISERVEPGIIEHLPPGKTVTFASPPGTTGYGEYSRNILRGIAAGYGVTYEGMTGDYSNVNFSSGRMGWLEFHRSVTDWQNNLIIPMLCEAVYKWFIQGCNIAGIITKEDFTASWTAPRREMIDPVKEIKALTDEVRAGFTSWADAVTAQGYDPEELLDEISKEYEKFRELSLMLTSDPRYDATRSVPVGPDGKSVIPPAPTEKKTAPAKKPAKTAAAK